MGCSCSTKKVTVKEVIRETSKVSILNMTEINEQTDMIAAAFLEDIYKTVKLRISLT